MNLTGKAGFSSDENALFEVEFGAVDHIHCPMFDTFQEKEYFIQLDHPVVIDATRKARTLFVISALYRSKICKIKVSWTLKKIWYANTDLDYSDCYIG